MVRLLLLIKRKPIASNLVFRTMTVCCPLHHLNKSTSNPRADVFAPDPKEDNDFTTLIKPEAMAELDKGHTCVNVQNPPPSIKAGANATFQIKYVASFDKPDKETFYACADITYVEFANFKEKVPCFNATVPEDSKKDTPTPTSDASKNSGSASSGLSGGGTAGVVIGVVGGVALIAVAALLIYRRKQQRLRMLRQKFSPRNIKPDGQHRDSPSVRSESA